MKKILLTAFVLLSLASIKAQVSIDTTGMTTDKYYRVDTFQCHLIIRKGNHSRTASGYVILKSNGSTCTVVEYLTIKKRKFPPRFEIADYCLTTGKRI